METSEYRKVQQALRNEVLGACFYRSLRSQLANPCCYLLPFPEVADYITSPRSDYNNYNQFLIVLDSGSLGFPLI